MAKTKKFIVAENFVFNTSSDALVRISYVGSNFKKWFLDKIEEPIDELEDGEKTETSLAKIYDLMLRQSKGEDSTLASNGHANVFFVPDSSNIRRVVFVRRFGAGWSVYANTVEYWNRWNGHVANWVFPCGFLRQA